MTWNDSSERKYLFSEYDMHALLEGHKKDLRDEIAAIDGNQMLNTSVDDLCACFVKKYRRHPPVLLEDQAEAEQQEAQIDVSNDRDRFILDRSRPLYVPGAEVTLQVPFEGEAHFFRVRPSKFTSTFPVAAVRGNTLSLSVCLTELTAEDTKDVKSQFDRLLGEIKNYLNWIADDVKPLNDELGALARQAIESRRQKLLAAQNLVASLGFPLKRRDDAPTTYAAPEVRRKAVPELPKASTAPFKPEPTLDMENYEHILKVVSSMVQVMEP